MGCATSTAGTPKPNLCGPGSGAAFGIGAGAAEAYAIKIKTIIVQVFMMQAIVLFTNGLFDLTLEK